MSSASRRAPRRSAARSRRRRSPRCTWPARTRSTCWAAIQASPRWPLGTETIAQVDLLAGPGNAYVAEAKRQLFGEVGIDLFAGPTEILVIADDTADPFVVAVDLLSQAEHGPDSPAVLDHHVARRSGGAVIDHVEELLPGHADGATSPGRPGATTARCIVVGDLDAAYALADDVRLRARPGAHRASRARRSEQMRNYGALFLGEGTCVSYGDKVIGTNHMLPTRGAARYTGGLWVGQVPEDGHLPGGHRPGGQRAARRALRSRGAASSSSRATPAPATCGPRKYAGAPLPWAPVKDCAPRPIARAHGAGHRGRQRASAGPSPGLAAHGARVILVGRTGQAIGRGRAETR